MFRLVGSDEPTNAGRLVNEGSLPRPDDQRSRGRNGALASVVVIAAYFLLGIAAFWPALGKISSNLFSQISTGGGDFTQSEWFIAWVPHALAHHLNPFFSDAMFAPRGVNLATNTASPLLGLLSVPFTLGLNPIARANLFLAIAMPISATSAFAVLRRWQVWLPASGVGGLIYGFSPYMIAQTQGHVELTFVPLPPLIAATVVSIVQDRRYPWRRGIQLGLLVAAQYLISPEVMATVVLVTVVALLCVVIGQRYLRLNVPSIGWTSGIIAVVVASGLLAYPVWMLIFGPQHITGRRWPVSNPFHNDLLSFIAPGSMQRIAFGMRALAGHLAPQGMEAGGYIGIPLLLLAAILAYRSRRSPRSQLALVLLVVTAILSLGPRLAIDGHTTSIPLPFAVLNHLPLLNTILAVRMSLEVQACLAAVIAFGLDDMRRGDARVQRHSSSRFWPIRDRRSMLFLALIVAALVITQMPKWPYSTAPANALPMPIEKAIPPGDPVAITYPFTTMYFVDPLVWQSDDGFHFRLLGGYAYHPWDNAATPTLGPSPMNPVALEEFLATQEGVYIYGPRLVVDQSLTAVTKITFAKYDIRVVIIDRSQAGSAQVVRLFDDVLGSPTVATGNYLLWNVGDRSLASGT